MDSEHRHELEENDLAKWLEEKIEQIKPQLPAYGVGLVVLIAGLAAFTGWRSSTAQAEAGRWQQFSNAIEKATPDLNMLKGASEANPGTPVAEWSSITWADGKLFEASTNFFRNRGSADESLEAAIEAYQKLVAAKDRDVAARANFQLARAYEMQGKLEDAIKQYGRVNGAFQEVAEARAEELASPKVAASYEWITATKTASSTSAIDSLLGSDELMPDDIEVPEIDADAELQDLLNTVEEEIEAEDAEATEEEAAAEE